MFFNVICVHRLFIFLSLTYIDAHISNLGDI